MASSSCLASCACMLAPAFAAPLIFANLARALSKSALRIFKGNAATPMITPARQSSAEARARMMPAWVDANKLRAKLIEGIARARRGDHGSAWPHLDGIGEARVVSVR